MTGPEVGAQYAFARRTRLALSRFAGDDISPCIVEQDLLLGEATLYEHDVWHSSGGRARLRDKCLRRVAGQALVDACPTLVVAEVRKSARHPCIGFGMATYSMLWDPVIVKAIQPTHEAALVGASLPACVVLFDMSAASLFMFEGRCCAPSRKALEEGRASQIATAPPFSWRRCRHRLAHETHGLRAAGPP